jgi:hypothetical protein
VEGVDDKGDYTGRFIFTGEPFRMVVADAIRWLVPSNAESEVFDGVVNVD